LVCLDKLDDDFKDLNNKLDTLINQSRPTEEPFKEWKIDPHQEKTSDSGLFGHYPPPFDSHKHKSFSIDNNVYHHLPKVNLNKFDGCNPSAWVTQTEHYFSLHGITNGMTKLKVTILYLDPK